jgi:hypothetical protein
MDYNTNIYTVWNKMIYYLSSYLCITLVKIRNAALQKKESLTSKYSKIPNVIYCEGMI